MSSMKTGPFKLTVPSSYLATRVPRCGIAHRRAARAIYVAEGQHVTIRAIHSRRGA